MICPKCGAEIAEESMFCNKCGSKLSLDDEKQDKQLIKVKDKLKVFNNKRNIIISCSVLIIIICTVGAIIYFNNPITKFKNNIKSNNSAEAIKVYSDKIKGDTNKENEINSYLKNDINKTKESFINEKIDYNKAKNSLETIKDTKLVSTDADNALDKVTKLNDSRSAFKKAQEFLKNNDYMNAVKEYKNVISDDKNYEKAKEQIKNNEKKYKEQVLKSVEASANSKDYKKSVSLLKEAIAVIPNDNDLTSKVSVYQKQLEQKLVAEQLVSVENARILVQDTTYKAIYPDMIEVLMKNTSQKTIKNMKVGCLGYDKNGYPLKIKTQYNFSGGNYEFVGNAQDVNVVSGESFGQNRGWKLDESHGISKVLACVKTVTFYDGTTWDNPYYEYWIEQYKEKPLN